MNSLTPDRTPSLTCEMHDNETLLKQIAYFGKLPMEAIRILAYLSTQKTFRAGEYLFHQNDDDGQGIFIICGRASMEYIRTGDSLGQNTLIVREITESTFIGGLALLGHMRRLFSIKALTDMDCLILTRDKFAAAMSRFPERMPLILQAMIDNIRCWEERCLVRYSGVQPPQGIEYCGISLL